MIGRKTVVVGHRCECVDEVEFRGEDKWNADESREGGSNWEELSDGEIVVLGDITDVVNRLWSVGEGLVYFKKNMLEVRVAEK